MRVYLDANATYGPLAEIEHKVQSLLAQSYNPSSVHAEGQSARATIESARDELAKLIDAPKSSSRIVFCSGATEANNHVVHLPFLSPNGYGSEVNHIVTTALEHPCIIEPAKSIPGVKTCFVRPNNSFQITPEMITEHVSEDTKLVSIMLANNETGQIFDVASIASAVRAKNPKALIHCDAAQAVGKIPVSYTELGVDLLSISGHKFGALTGIGALVISDAVESKPYIAGGAQEHRWRSGTENVVGIGSIGLASKCHQLNGINIQRAMLAEKEMLLSVLSEISDIEHHIPTDISTLPNTINVRVHGIKADDLVVALDLAGVCISSGSACSSGKPLPSPVITAMGFSEEHAKETIRISTRGDHTDAEIEFAANQIKGAIERMRSKRAA